MTVQAMSVEPFPTGIIKFSTYVNAVVLSANTAKRVAIPTGYRFVDFQTPLDFYAKPGDSSVTAAIPSGDVSDGTAAECNPKFRSIGGGYTHISMISDTDGVITLAWHGA